jgi:hypothetical protein
MFVEKVMNMLSTAGHLIFKGSRNMTILLRFGNSGCDAVKWLLPVTLKIVVEFASEELLEGNCEL